MIPIPQAQLPPWPETKAPSDRLDAARGIVFSALFSIPAWAFVAFLIWLVVA